MFYHEYFSNIIIVIYHHVWFHVLVSEMVPAIFSLLRSRPYVAAFKSMEPIIISLFMVVFSVYSWSESGNVKTLYSATILNTILNKL